MKHVELLRLLGLTIGVLTTGTAWGSSIQFFNTGVAADGSPLAAGTADSHYSLLYSADSNGSVATVTSPNSAWQAGTTTAGWISPGSSGNQSWSSGYYVYETLLDLTGFDPATAVLSGTVAADDEVYIYLNRGGSALYAGSGFSSSLPFLINSGFVSGLNEVDFVIHNDGGPTGLMVDNSLATATTPTPELGSFLLTASGTAIGAFGISRRLLRDPKFT